MELPTGHVFVLMHDSGEYASPWNLVSIHRTLDGAQAADDAAPGTQPGPWVHELDQWGDESWRRGDETKIDRWVVEP